MCMHVCGVCGVHVCMRAHVCACVCVRVCMGTHVCVCVLGEAGSSIFSV